RCCRSLPSEPYVRLSPHTAQAFTNVPHGTRNLPSNPTHGPADGSWGGPGRDCPAGRRPHTPATAGDGGANPGPALAAGHRPDNVLPDTATRYAPADDPASCPAAAFANAARSTAPRSDHTGSRLRGEPRAAVAACPRARTGKPAPCRRPDPAPPRGTPSGRRGYRRSRFARAIRRNGADGAGVPNTTDFGTTRGPDGKRSWSYRRADDTPPNLG